MSAGWRRPARAASPIEGIEADPEPRRVIIETTPKRNPWFLTPVRIVRWRDLAE
jgi:hypothetical protein